MVREISKTDLEQFIKYEWSFPKIVKFRSLDNKYELNGLLTLPPKYNPQKKYPLIIYGYGMPGTQIVWNKWGNIWNQFLAQQGYVIFSMDSRGMGGRGEKFKNYSYGDISKYLAQDHIAGIKYLEKEWNIDSERIGAWGWSGGGYFTCLMLTRNGKYFKTGVAVAPCTDFELYDTAYTERFMGLKADNITGYDSTNTIKWLNNMKGNLLLIHGDLDDNEIEIAISESNQMPSFEIPGMPGANVGMINISDMLGKSMGQKPKKKKMTVKESHEILINEESDKLIEQDKIIKSAKDSTENNGIVFLDEIDKISARTDRVGGDVSREGVQRDLLPLIEGTTVSTKYGPVKTDHILFIASGAFQLAKPSDLLPELQGRLPIRVELDALNSDDFIRILKEPDNSLIKQYKALLKTEKVDLEFTEEGINTIAHIASEVNSSVENIGARRLHTIIERVLDEISFTATDRAGEKIVVDGKYIKDNIGELVKDTDLSKFIL